MARTYLVFIMVAGVLTSMVGSLGSNSRGSEGPESRVGRAEATMAGGEAAAPASADAVELERESNGHFYADVEINGMPIRVLVDTGASGIALSRDDARRAGLAVSAGMFEVVGEGAAGAVRGEYVTLDRVSLGAARAESMPAVVLDSGGQSLLGQSFLSRFDSVEIRGDTMVLR